MTILAQGALQNLPVGTVSILTGRELPLTPCPDPAVMTKARRDKFEEAARLAEQNAALREQAWTLEAETIPATIAQEADDATGAARSGAPIAPSKVPEMHEEVERLQRRRRRSSRRSARRSPRRSTLTRPSSRRRSRRPTRASATRTRRRSRRAKRSRPRSRR